MSTRVWLSSAAALALMAGAAVAQSGGGSGGGSASGGSSGMSSGGSGAMGAGSAGGAEPGQRSGGGKQMGAGERQPSGSKSGANEMKSERRSGSAENNSGSATQHTGGTAERQGLGPQRSGQAQTGDHDRTGSISSGSNISTKQKSEIKTHMSSANIKAATNVKISKVSVGVVVPTTIEQYWEPVPASIVEIVPAWRSYRVVRIHNEVVIIEPSTRKIVYVIQG